MNKKKVAIIGSHGLYANYGGWDQLVRNLAEKKSENIEYLIFNSADTKKVTKCPHNVKVKRLKFKASGFQGLLFDFWSILLCYFKVDALLLLGTQGIPLIGFFRIFKKKNIVSNVGGIEWERPKFGYFSKKYLVFCFKLSFKYSSTVILDNKHYESFVPKKSKANIKVIPYGGEIDISLEINNDMIEKYPFLKEEYFLSISRALEDNMLDELCNSFKKSTKKLVLISNFSSSKYGEMVYDKYKDHKKIILINGLYNKPELDLVRKNCKAYIHTHTLCGTAPSLVEMIISQRPIISVDIPQNRFTLDNQGFFYKSYNELEKFLLQDSDFIQFVPKKELIDKYDWKQIVNLYEELY